MREVDDLNVFLGWREEAGKEKEAWDTGMKRLIFRAHIQKLTSLKTSGCWRKMSSDANKFISEGLRSWRKTCHMASILIASER